MSRVNWRWDERDFGFRFRTGIGPNAVEHYQAAEPDNFYIVPGEQRQLDADALERLASTGIKRSSSRIVPNPWCNYHRLKDWDWIETEDGILFNVAGCLDREEISRREDEGVQRAMELVLDCLDAEQPLSLTIDFLKRIHLALMGRIYPFAGEWRTVSLHKGAGPIKWPLPPGGIEPLMTLYAHDVLSRTPFLSDDNHAVFHFISEAMSELLAIHPFREGNGRTAFIIANLFLMQNDMLPLNRYDRRVDRDRYIEACEAGRIQRNYSPLAALLEEWEERAVTNWEVEHGT